MGKDYLKTATLITSYLKARFISNKADMSEREKKVWADQLATTVDADQLTQQNIKAACDLYAEINGNGFPPTVDQFMKCLRKVSFDKRPDLSINNKQLNYMDEWNNAKDDAKLRFFIDHNYLNTPPVIRWLFHDYNTKHRGWTKKESIKMMQFHGRPFSGAGQGAMVNHQRDVMQYFINRKVKAA